MSDSANKQTSELPAEPQTPLQICEDMDCPVMREHPTTECGSRPRETQTTAHPFGYGEFDSPAGVEGDVTPCCEGKCRGHSTESAEPQTPEPKKYSACRICGRGPTTMGQHVAIATFGVHTDANGKPNQPNKGTAYCDQCEDETLVIQPAAPVSSDARPDRQTVEQAKAELRAYVCREFAVEDHDDDWLMPHIDALIAAVRADTLSAVEQEATRRANQYKHDGEQANRDIEALYGRVFHFEFNHGREHEARGLADWCRSQREDKQP